MATNKIVLLDAKATSFIAFLWLNYKDFTRYFCFLKHSFTYFLLIKRKNGVIKAEHSRIAFLFCSIKILKIQTQRLQN